MAGRARAFADPEIVRLAKETFVAVACDDWYQRRRQDAEGEFFRKVADQGPRKGNGTRQGVYCLTADGRLLAYRPGDVAVEYMLETLQRGLAAWEKIPAAQRKPGAVAVGDAGKIDARFDRQPPKGGLILRVYVRALERDGETFRDSDCDKERGGQSQLDHLWLTEREWQSLIPEKPSVGATVRVPTAIARRIFRFHLVDSTRGEPPFWDSEELHEGELTLKVDTVDASKVTMSIAGTALMASHRELSQAERGYDAALAGKIVYDRSRKAIEKFDLVAVGDHWGEGTYTRGARPGKAPVGVAFELGTAEIPTDRIPPQAARDLQGYFRAE